MQNKRIDPEQVLNEVELHLRNGERGFAQTKLDQILNSSVKISRNHYVKLAEALRRSGQPQKALKLLFRFVRGKGHNFRPASLPEKEEYAASLLAVKATEEAFLGKYHSKPTTLISLKLGQSA